MAAHSRDLMTDIIVYPRLTTRIATMDPGIGTDEVCSIAGLISLVDECSG